jgi:hypothetical protein
LKWWYGIVFNLTLAVLAVSGAAFFALRARGPGEGGGGNYRLEIRDARSGKLYGRWPAGEGTEFALEFIHSVHQSPVRETFAVEGKRIRPVAARFFSFGAGMASDLEEGQVLSRDGEALVIKGFSRSFFELNYIVGTVSDHLLFIHGETVSLRDLCGKNAGIRIFLR